jgi:DNA end-binding protein Ku
VATTVWKGYLAFGLVSIPVRLFRAARAERVPLRQLYRTRSSEVAPPVHPRLVQSQSPLQSQLENAHEVATADNTPASEVIPVRRIYEPAVIREEPGEEANSMPAPELVKGYEYEKGRYVVLDEQELRSVAPKTTTEMQIVEFVRFAEVDPLYLETS